MGWHSQMTPATQQNMTAAYTRNTLLKNADRSYSVATAESCHSSYKICPTMVMICGR